MNWILHLSFNMSKRRSEVDVSSFIKLHSLVFVARKQCISKQTGKVMTRSADVHQIFVFCIVCVRDRLPRPLHATINFADAGAAIATMTSTPEEGKLATAVEAAGMVIERLHPRRGHRQHGLARRCLGTEGVRLHRLDSGGQGAAI